jgi:MOSC domain-containing protein YiiM
VAGQDGPHRDLRAIGLRFDDPEMVKRFHAAGRNGFHLAVERTGHMAPDDLLEVVDRHPQRVTPHDLAELQAGGAELTASTPQES